MTSPHRMAQIVSAIVAPLTLAGCSSFATANLCHIDLRGTQLCPPATVVPPPPPTRATIHVDGLRGNPRVLMFLAFSGGGSRAASLSTETMIALKSFAGGDLLAEVDVMSAVSGGALPAAFYAATRDASLALPQRSVEALQVALGSEGSPRQLKLGQGTVSGGAPLRLECDAELGPDGVGWLMRLDSGVLDLAQIDRIKDLCRQSALTKLRHWSDDDARERMSRNYIGRMLGNFLWPGTFLRYWFTAYDRSDVMAQTLSDNLYDQPVLGIDYRFEDLNPTRPYLIIHATNGTERLDDPEHDLSDHQFGSAFAFTQEDFVERLHSNVGSYPLGQAVMASSAFPLVFPHVTLENFHSLKKERRCPTGDDALATCSDRRYLHLIDGGNADNLGLRSVKRMLIEMAASGRLVADYDSVIVVLVDAFTRPAGSSSRDADPRSLIGRLVDISSLTEAVDVLLQAGRQRALDEFDDPARLLSANGDCNRGELPLPDELCTRLRRQNTDEELAAARKHLADRLVFYHFGFETIEKSTKAPARKRELDRIPTSFSIDDKHVELIRSAVRDTLRDDNRCLKQLASIIRKAIPTKEDADHARATCGKHANDEPPPVHARQQ